MYICKLQKPCIFVAGEVSTLHQRLVAPFANMDQLQLNCVGWNCLSIPKLQLWNSWSLWMDKQFHPTLHQARDCLSVLGFELIHVSERGHWRRKLLNVSIITLDCFCNPNIVVIYYLSFHCKSLSGNQSNYPFSVKIFREGQWNWHESAKSSIESFITYSTSIMWIAPNGVFWFWFHRQKV